MDTPEELQPEVKKKTIRAPRVKKPKAMEGETVSAAAAVSDAPATKPGQYIGTLGRRKTSIARVRFILQGTGAITINQKEVDRYFTTYELRNIVKSSLKMAGQETAVDVQATVEGGGIRGQAEAVRLGITRALVSLNPAYRKTLKKLGYLTRDPREKERKKPGLKRARRAPQWSKR